MTCSTPEQHERARGCGGRFAVIGSPIAHSHSPRLHRAAYAAAGRDDFEYGRYEVTSADFDGFLSGPGTDLSGLSVTMPCKPLAFAAAVTHDDAARATGACNTLVRRDDGAWDGYNTDVYGIVAALRERGVGSCERPVILGGGSTAASAIVACAALGARSVQVSVRSAARAAHLHETAAVVGVRLDVCEDLGGPWRAGIDLLISTLPAGVGDASAAALAAAEAPGGTVRTLPRAALDVVYAPWPTRLASVLEAADVPVASGFDMLLHQAVAQVRLMTGIDPDVGAMRAALSAVQEH